jgi:tetratricopeptide (TPR) repeat protein
VILAAIGIYANSLRNDFTYDDRPICLEDSRTRDLTHLRELFTQSYWAGSSLGGLDLSADRLDPLYRPVTLLSFAVNHALTGLHPARYRLVNLLLHAGVCAAVYVLGMILFRRRLVACITGLVFAVHPVHTEAVVPMVGRSELLAAITVLGALILYIQDALAGPPRPITWRYVLTLVLFLLAVFSKESAITFAGLAVAADVWVRLRGPAWTRSGPWSGYLLTRLTRRYFGVLAIVIFFLLVRRHVVGHLFSSADLIPPTLNVLVIASWPERVLTCLAVLARYVYLLFIPYPLSYDYSSPAIELQRSLLSRPVLAGLACVVGMVIAIILSERRRGQVAAAVIFFLIAYSVASNLVFRIGVLMAERLIYLPSVGVCLLWGLAAAAIADRWPARPGWPEWLKSRLSAGGLAAALGIGTLLIVYGVLTVRRNAVWRNNEVLYETGLRIQPRSHKCWLNLGLFHLSRNDETRGLSALREALRLAPNSYDALGQLGWYYARHGQREEALKLLEQAARYRWPAETFTLWIRAQLYQDAGRTEDAVRCYEEVLRHKPDHQLALVNLVGIYADSDSGRYYDLNRAYRYASRAAQLPAPQPQAVVALADVCTKMGRRDEARAAILRGFKLLAAYRDKAREMGKLQEQVPVYDQLEASLRTMLATLDGVTSRPKPGR